MARKETTYDETQIAERLKELPGWYLEDGWIRRVYKTDGWPTTLMLVNAIGYLSEAAYHHPDLSVTWAAAGAVRLDDVLDRDLSHGNAPLVSP